MRRNRLTGITQRTTKLGTIMKSESGDAEQAPATNRRPRFAFAIWCKFDYRFCAPLASPAAVGEARTLGRLAPDDYENRATNKKECRTPAPSSVLRRVFRH